VGTPQYDCPNLNADVGDSCNDGNSNTTNDIVQSDCTCQGNCVCTTQYNPVCGDDGNTYSNPCVAACAGITNYTFGTCDTSGGGVDCPNLNADIGDSCNDGNSNTTNDTVNSYCQCVGTPTPPGGDYCHCSGNNSNYEWIKRVKCADLDHNSGRDGGYGDYTNKYANCNAGQSYTIELHPGFSSSSYNEFWKVWVDFNRDGDFNDSGERICYGNGNGMISKNFTVPSNVSDGACRMRVTMRWNSYASSCGTISYGEVEDYTMMIGGEPSGGGNNNTYCSGSANNSSYEWIDRVQCSNLNNQSGSDAGHGDYTNQTMACNRGDAYDITLTPGFSGTAYNEFWKVWIDYNQDGDFSDSGELVCSGHGTSSITRSFSVPANAQTGNTRMRVAMRWNTSPAACGTMSYGEVEDYTVDIRAGNIGGGNAAFRTVKPEPTVSIYPNPVHSELNVELESIGEGQLEIYNNIGQLIQTQAIDEANTSLRINTSAMQAGIYMMVILLKRTIKINFI